MVLVDKLDELGKPAWIALAVLGFMAWWPIGLAVLAFFLGSGRMGSVRMACWQGHSGGPWQHQVNRHVDRWQSKMERMQEKMDRMRTKMDQSRTAGGTWWGTPPTSGNRAFDDYRTETLRRLEDEQQEFKDFLERLRFAKDRAEFDQFMNERRNGAEGGSQPAPHPGPQPQI